MNFVQPIKNRKDIDKMKNYLHKSNIRNYTLFVTGINSLLRVSDLLNLQITDITNPDGSIKDRLKLREQKTNKLKDFNLNSGIKEALTEYLSGYPTFKKSYTHTHNYYHNHKDSCLFPSEKWFNQEDYINRSKLVDFLRPYIPEINAQIKQYKSINEIALVQGIDLKELVREFLDSIFNEIDKNIGTSKNQNIAQSKWIKIKEFAPNQIQDILNTKGHDPITRQTVHNFLKEASKEVKLKENVGSHSMRKTASYAIYMNNIKTNPGIIDTLQKMLNHSSSSTTLRYLGITQDVMDEVYLDNVL